MLFSLLRISLCTLISLSSSLQAKELYKVRLANSIHKLFPNSPEQMQHRLEKYMQEVSKSIKGLKSIPYQERTFDNIALKLDAILHKSNLAIFGKAVNTLNLMHPDENMRKKSDESLSTINKFFVEIMSDKQLYEAFKHCLNNTQRTLSQPEQYYYEQTMANFKRAGLELANDQLEQVKNLQNELFELELTWQNNITNDDTKLIFSLEELEGLDKEFIETKAQRLERAITMTEGKNTCISFGHFSFVNFKKRSP